MRDQFKTTKVVACLSILLGYLHVSTVCADPHRARIRKHATKLLTDRLDNSLPSENEIDADMSNDNSQVVNRDLVDKMSWKCANNASCLYALVNGAYQSYKRGETVKLGPFDLVKLPAATSASDLKFQHDFTETGRGMSSFMEFVRGNAIRVPIGPMVFSIQRAEDDSNYIEVALLKKSIPTARHQSMAKTGGNGGLLGGSGSGGGGLLGGGLLGSGGGIGGSGIGGGGIGGGEGIGGGGRRRKQQHEKKQFQMYIPMYLAATTFGWTMVAAKAVGLLTLKALIVSKLAFVVAASIIIKKLMDNASEKLMYQYPDHGPFMMPYNMEYPMHSMGSELATNEMFHPSALQFGATSPLQQQAHAGLESYGAESHLHHNIAEVQNNTQVLAALNAAGLGQKVKREDAWIAKTKRPLVYNYVNPQHPYYRA